jgi:hypothetical protein
MHYKSDDDYELHTESPSMGFDDSVTVGRDGPPKLQFLLQMGHCPRCRLAHGCRMVAFDLAYTDTVLIDSNLKKRRVDTTRGGYRVALQVSD